MTAKSSVDPTRLAFDLCCVNTYSSPVNLLKILVQISDLKMASNSPNACTPPSSSNAVNITQGQGAIPLQGFATATRKPETKLINVNLFKSESSTLFQLSQEESAKLIQPINIRPKELFSISAYDKFSGVRG